jgi:catechol 2,3-dioxygenase-like lactoylglutathione lyase family enzyme
MSQPEVPQPSIDGQTDLVIGLHHIRIPVTDAWVSRDWYSSVLGFVPVLDFENADGVVGVVLRHRTGVVIGLHKDAMRARELHGFALLGLAVAGEDELRSWSVRLDRAGVAHGPLEEGHLGWYIELPDPDGIVVRLHAGLAPYAEQA